MILHCYAFILFLLPRCHGSISTSEGNLFQTALEDKTIPVGNWVLSNDVKEELSYIKYARCAYSTDEKVVSRCGPPAFSTPKENGAAPQCDKGDMTFRIWIKKDEVIVSFRGSTSRNNFVSDIKFFPLKQDAPWPPGIQIHKGFFREFQCALHRRWFDSLHHALSQCRECTLVFTGHSLGGAVARIAAVYTLRHLNVKVKIITYGAPRCGNRVFAKWLDMSENVVRNVGVSLEGDPVPFFPATSSNCKEETYFHSGLRAHYRCVIVDVIWGDEVRSDEYEYRCERTTFHEHCDRGKKIWKDLRDRVLHVTGMKIASGILHTMINTIRKKLHADQHGMKKYDELASTAWRAKKFINRALHN